MTINKTLHEQGLEILESAKGFSGKRAELLVNVAQLYFFNHLKIQASNISSPEVPSYFALVLQGGGVKGLAYIGAIKELNNYYSFNWFVGTSAGAITSALLAADIDLEKIEEIIINKNFISFIEVNPFRILSNIVRKGALWSGDKVENFINEIISTHLNITYNSRFKDLKHRLTVYTSKRGSKGQKFETYTTPEKEVSYSIKSSMAIPFIFAKQSDDGYDLYDGGIQNNYPARIFREENPDQKFIGLFLGNDKYKPKKKKGNAISNIISIWLNGSDNEALRNFKDETIIINPEPITTLNFYLTAKSKEHLLNCGKLAAKKYLIKKSLLEENLSNLEDSILNTRNQIKKRKLLYRILSFIIITIVVTIIYFFI